MNTQKNFLHYLAQAINQYRADRRTSSVEETAPSSPKPGRFRRVLRWLTPNGGTLLLLAALILTQNVWARQMAAPAAPGPSATTINYQGRLHDSDGAPLNGTVSLSFTIYDALTGGNVIWEPEVHEGVEVVDGLFNVGLGSKTSGGIPTNVWNGDRYLEVAVNGQPLSPRELIRSVPIAGMALQAYTVPDGSITDEKLARRYELGTVETDDSWADVTFSEPFDTPPLILSTMMTYNGGDPSFVRIQNVTETGFQIRVQEPNDEGHATETIVWMAIAP